ncbi:carboxypeptidase B-like isoform X1 [Varroa jacobsoni]|uniref:carboxypeptidase B-like isoform X1 n=1 Tax=Varroa jacobsoni TaxID=62625 RepID=UPI000BF54F92|nr:carboxypeptidase B-like isoform X1 [Varroa jacobsoni]
MSVRLALTFVACRLAIMQMGAVRIDSIPKVVPYDEASIGYAGDGDQRKNYTNHHLFVARIESEHQKEGLEHLKEQFSSLDFWNPVFVMRNVSIRVPPEFTDPVKEILKKHKVAYTVASKNLQAWIDHEKIENPQQNLFLLGSDPSRFNLNQYHSYDEISAYIDAIANRYSDVAQVSNIGSTYEGRQIKGLKISSGGKDKPVIWIDSGIHAREWISPATSLYIINKLVTGAKSDPTARALVSLYDFHIYPLLNADGYARTWSGDRMWRKNRVRFQGYSCQGVDPNRNFGYDFAGTGSNGDVCSDSYRGPQAFSELESQAIRNGIQSLDKQVKMFFTLHSYGQLIMLPYGSGPRIQSRFYNDQLQIARAGQRAISAFSGVHYEVGTIQQLFLAAAGGAADWAHESGGIKYAYAIELRDKGRFGFMLPASQIALTSEECYSAVIAMVDEMARKETGRPVLPAGQMAKGNGQGGANQIPQTLTTLKWPPQWS